MSTPVDELLYLFNEFVKGVPVGEVGLESRKVPAKGPDLFFDGAIVPGQTCGNADDIGARGGEAQRHALADALVRAGDQCDLPVQIKQLIHNSYFDKSTS